MIKKRAIFLILTAAALCPAGTAQADEAHESISVLDSVLGNTPSLKGQVVYLDFWASWCPPCARTFPWMKQMQETYGKRGLRIVTVNLDRDRDKAEAFLERLDVELRVVFDTDGRLAGTYGVNALPSSFIYGRDGKLYVRHDGFHKGDSEELEGVIRALLEDEPGT